VEHQSASDTSATKLLGAAYKSLREGRNQTAVQLFGGIAKVNDFSYWGQAAYGEAIALARCGKLPEASKKFESLKDKYTDRIVLRANILRGYAETKITLGQFDVDVDGALEEAAQIYKEQGMLPLLGAVIHLQGIVAVRKGEIELAIQNFDWATMFGDTLFPDFVPDVWVSEQPTEASVLTSPQTALSGANF